MVWAALSADQAQQYVLGTFGKDSTLTGRTYLWQVAEEKLAERPTLGWGYKYLWMSGSDAATGMMRSQNVSDPRTFSMHNNYLEAATDTGLVGLGLLLTTMLASMLGACVRAVVQGSRNFAFLAVLLLQMIVRCSGDVIIGPFYGYCAILFAMFGYSLFGDRSPRDVITPRATAMQLPGGSQSDPEIRSGRLADRPMRRRPPD
jgi:exopolysaccharide production protein ExoQ